MAPATRTICVLSLAVIGASTVPLRDSNCSSTATIDPSNVTRNGDDFASVPLVAPNATLYDCIGLCCGTPSCAAFSYNNPQPERTCLGAQCCEVGSVCCMLKNAVPLPTPNTYGPAVTTGVVYNGSNTPLPGPTPPFPLSTLIINVSFGNVSWWGTGTNQGDTWPSMWASDGTLYAWACDNLNNSPSTFALCCMILMLSISDTILDTLLFHLRCFAPLQ